MTPFKLKQNEFFIPCMILLYFFIILSGVFFTIGFGAIGFALGVCALIQAIINSVLSE